MLKTNRLRADTTVVPGDVGYPTDSGLLARGVVRLTALVATLHVLGLATRTKLRDRGRSMRRRAHDIGAWLRRRGDLAKEETLAITAEMATIAETSLAEAKKVAGNARRGLRRAGEGAPGKARAALAELEMLIARLETVVAQTRVRLSGEVPEGATRLVSLHDPDARPIKKGRIGKPVEFGYLAQVLDNEDGIVVDHGVYVGNPPDVSLLAPAIERVKAIAGRAPRAVTADRGYGEARVEDQLTALGVKFVAIIRKGRPGAARRAVERGPGSASSLSGGPAPKAGSRRSNAPGVGPGASWTAWRVLRIWCGYGIFANNSQKISRLMAEKRPVAGAGPPPPNHPRRAPTGPPPRVQPPPALPIPA